MALETAFERILRVLKESEGIDPALKTGLEEGIELLQKSPTVPGFMKIVEKNCEE
jgi:hypothetical protein